MKKETQQQNESILIEEDLPSIKKIHEDAANRASYLNKLCTIVPIQSYADYEAITRDVDHFIKLEMLKDSQIKNLSKLVDLNTILIPEPLQQVKRFVEHFPEPDQLMTGLVRKQNKWMPDQEYLKQKEETFRRYATTEYQKKRYHAAKDLADFINSQKVGPFNMASFASILVEFKTDGKAYPNVRYVLASEDAFMS